MAWRQELWRRQRVHLAALDEDVTMVGAGHPNYVVRSPPSVVAPASGAGRECMTRRHKKKKKTQHNDHRKLQRSKDDLHIGQATQRKKKKKELDPCTTTYTSGGRHKKANVEEAEGDGEEVADVADGAPAITTTITTSTRQKKKRSRSFRWADKIKHLARSESFSDDYDHDDNDNDAAEVDADHQPRLRRERAPSDEVFDVGAHQVHALAWYQRLRAAGHPQRNA